MYNFCNFFWEVVCATGFKNVVDWYGKVTDHENKGKRVFKNKYE